jgi:flavin reductase
MPDVVSAAMNQGGQPNQINNAFRLAMRQMGQTVTVVACSDPATGDRYGLTASSVTSVSMEPPSIVVCINNDATMRPFIAIGTRISINVLGEDQSAISNAFATEPEAATRFKHGTWTEEPIAADEISDTGRKPAATPYLADCASHMLATIREMVPWGTHVLIIAEISSAMTDPQRKPLMYHDGGYLRLGQAIKP